MRLKTLIRMCLLLIFNHQDHDCKHTLCSYLESASDPFHFMYFVELGARI